MADVESLLEEIVTLRDMVAERDALLAGFTIIETELKTAKLEIEHLKLQLATLRRQRFGRSSEKLDREISQLELRLEELEENLGEKVAAQDAQAKPESNRDRKDRRKPGGRKPLPAHLPRETVVHEPEIRCTCGNCDPGRLVKIGESKTEVLEKIPARFKVIEHVRPKFACRLCEAVFQAPAPELPIEGGRPGPGLLANVAVSKYCDGLPLYRQTGIFAREGIEIDRATLADWMGHVAWWVMPLAERIGEYVLGHDVVWTDDTPIRTLAPGNGKTRISRFWCYAVDPRPYDGPGHPAVFYRYSANRKGEQPRGHLENFSGYLHTDAFAGYNALYRTTGNQPPRVINVACMAHARRKVFDVFEKTKSPIAEEALRRIQDLYAIEAKINGRPADERRAARQQHSKPLLDDLHPWLKEQRRRLPGKSPLGKAFQYSLSRWDGLTRYLEDGRLSIDNNLSERLIRDIAMTRKNYLFLGSDRGGDRAAAIYTIIESAKLIDLNPEAYLAEVLDRMARGHPITRLDELLPWNVKARQAAAAA